MSHPLANRLYGSGTFVAENYGKKTLGIVPAKCVGVSMTHASKINLHSNFTSFRRVDRDFFDT